jgi:phosphate transport system permease protein
LIEIVNFPSTVPQNPTPQFIQSRGVVNLARSRASSVRELFESAAEWALFVAAFISVLTSVAIVTVLGVEGLLFFEQVPLWRFLTDLEWTPLFADKQFGILPLLCGTALTSAIALLVALPLGLIIAIYLSEFASKKARAVLKPLIEILAGIPTIVYGYFALMFVTPLLQTFIPGLSTFNSLGAGIVMGLMILPMVVSLSDDALYTLPQSLRNAAYALGTTRLQMVFRLLVPAALGGITASFILAMSRAVGETMIVAIAAGQQPTLTLDPRQPVATMTAFIVQVSLGDTPHGSLEYRSIFVVGGALFLITLGMNFLSLRIRERYKFKL